MVIGCVGGGVRIIPCRAIVPIECIGGIEGVEGISYRVVLLGL